MKLRTVCSAISYVVALGLSLPSPAFAAPADVSGAEKPLASNAALTTDKRSQERAEIAGPMLHIEELAANRLEAKTRANSKRYDDKYLARFQESLTQKLASELELRINDSEW